MQKQSVLFLCTGNSCRSQMAEALLRERAGDRFEAFSAGTEPKGIHPLTIQVLKEMGIDTSKLRSKNLIGILRHHASPCNHLFAAMRKVDVQRFQA